MGDFVIELGGADARERSVVNLSNFVPYEGLEYILRRMFEPTVGASNLVIGISGPDVRNPAAQDIVAPADKFLTFADVTNSSACEGGAFDSNLRTSFGYGRVNAAFTSATVVRGGEVTSVEAIFPNEHDWSPQDQSAWDNPQTTPFYEPAPPEWGGRTPPDPILGFPYHYPRKLANDSGTNLAYMKTWDPSGSLDWMADFRTMGGFPVSMVWVAAPSIQKLIAVAHCRERIRLWPGIRMHATYRGRFYQRNALSSKAFMVRLASRCFENAGSGYSSVRAVPVLSSFTGPTIYTTYADLVPHLPAIAAFTISAWTYVTYAVGPPEVFPHLRTTSIPTWQNNSGSIISGIRYVAVYGMVGSTEELMWIHELPSPVDLDIAQRLVVTDGIKFYLETE